MAINGEGIWWASAANSGSAPKTYTWSVDFPPQPTLAKVWTTFFMEYGNVAGHMYSAGIKSFIREAGAIQLVPVDNVPAVGDNDMSGVTFGLYLYKCQVTVVLHLSFYD